MGETDRRIPRREMLRSVFPSWVLPAAGVAVGGIGAVAAGVEAAHAVGERVDALEQRVGNIQSNVTNLSNLAHRVGKLEDQMVTTREGMDILARADAMILFERKK